MCFPSTAPTQFSVESSKQPISQVINCINDGETTDNDGTQSEIFTVENQNVIVTEKSNLTPQPRKSANKRSYSQISHIENSINKLEAISNSCREDDDEFDLFAKSIAVQLRKMPLDRAFVCQEKLMCVMKEERLYQQRPQTYVYMPQSSPDLFSEQSMSSSWSDIENRPQAETSADILSRAIKYLTFIYSLKDSQIDAQTSGGNTDMLFFAAFRCKDNHLVTTCFFSSDHSQFKNFVTKYDVLNCRLTSSQYLYSVLRIIDELFSSTYFIKTIKAKVQNNVKEVNGELLESPAEYHNASEIEKYYNFKSGINYELKRKFGTDKMLESNKQKKWASGYRSAVHKGVGITYEELCIKFSSILIGPKKFYQHFKKKFSEKLKISVIFEEKFMENLVPNFQNLAIKEKNFTIFQPQNYLQIFAILTYFQNKKFDFDVNWFCVKNPGFPSFFGVSTRFNFLFKEGLKSKIEAFLLFQIKEKQLTTNENMHFALLNLKYFCIKNSLNN
ncbi:hypothetical protein AGLY_017462 [Aphis glycines]|uniref:BESS domain-containing protein n=1 Tax=Aphis glycines TaxID=307491 RepID=A0A6G0SVB1_APHGL|nr:hypothetical protein AGLY_017462 [Aphis glycines]